MTKKIGIIGFGEMGKRHGLEFREATKGCIEICGVVEPDDMMYQRGCEWNEIPDIPHFETVGDLLKYAHPDGIIISWNHYRPHEGLGGNMVMPYPQDMDAPVREVSFLGGLLHGYRRERLAA